MRAGLALSPLEARAAFTSTFVVIFIVTARMVVFSTFITAAVAASAIATSAIASIVVTIAATICEGLRHPSQALL